MKTTAIDYQVKEITPAFPNDGHAPVWALGLSKREYFAACALQGILADTDSRGVDVSEICHQAVRCADALSTALNKVKP